MSTSAALQPLSDIEIRLLWYLWEAREPQPASDLWFMAGGLPSFTLKALCDLKDRGLVECEKLMCRLTEEGRKHLLTLVAAGKYRFARTPDEAQGHTGRVVAGETGAEGSTSLPSAPRILKPHTPEKCDCGKPMVRRCQCGKPICNHHGYQLQEREPGSPILCGECKAADVESAAEQIYGRADAR